MSVFTYKYVFTQTVAFYALYLYFITYKVTSLPKSLKERFLTSKVLNLRPLQSPPNFYVKFIFYC